MGLDALTWSCHVCGRTRPDALIGVASVSGEMPGTSIELRVTVRYCADRYRCRKQAQIEACRRWAQMSDPPISALS